VGKRLGILGPHYAPAKLHSEFYKALFPFYEKGDWPETVEQRHLLDMISVHDGLGIAETLGDKKQ
jgi:hypothetical protein